MQQLTRRADHLMALHDDPKLPYRVAHGTLLMRLYITMLIVFREASGQVMWEFFPLKPVNSDDPALKRLTFWEERTVGEMICKAQLNSAEGVDLTSLGSAGQ